MIIAKYNVGEKSSMFRDRKYIDIIKISPNRYFTEIFVGWP